MRPALMWTLGSVVAAVLATVAALVLTAGAAPLLLADAGPLVRWGFPLVSVLANMAAAVVLGGLMLLVFVLPLTNAWLKLRTVVAVAAAAWTVLLAAQLVFSYAVTAGRTIGGDGFDTELLYFITEIPVGQARLIAVILAAVATVICTAIAGYGSSLFALVASVAVLFPLSTTGHAAGSNNHDLAMTALFLHIVTAAIWLGALLVLLVLVRWFIDDPVSITTRPNRRSDRERPKKRRARGAITITNLVKRYSRIALWCFAGVWISGVVNALLRLGAWSDLLTAYGLLVLTKAVITAALGLFGWWHRRVTIPRLESRPRLFWRIAGIEVLILGAVMGLAGALSASEPPVPQEPRAGLLPAEVLSGRSLPPEPEFTNWLTQFYPDLLFGLIAFAMAFMYLRWVLRLRKRGDHWPVGRTILWLIGVAGFAYVSLGGPAVYGMLMLSAHMIGHMTLVMVLPIFFVLAAPVSLALRALPVRSDGSRGPREWILAIIHSKWAGFFAHPVVAAGNVVGSMVLFYFTGLLELAMTTHLGHILMVVHFSLAGYMFANVLIGIDPGFNRPTHALRMLLLFVTMAAHAFFGIALNMNESVLAADYFGALGLPWGVDALDDQVMAGQITWGIGEIPSLFLALLVGVSWVRDDERTARRLDRQAERDNDAELNAYNEMLAGLSEDRPGGSGSQERNPSR